nr:MAG TPA: hypothetical protein [Caudoviricetes sp.]
MERRFACRGCVRKAVEFYLMVKNYFTGKPYSKIPKLYKTRN